jgi:hypothetical protein
MAAMALAACSPASAHPDAGGPGDQAGTGASIVAGADCSTPGLLYCSGGPGSIVLFCGAVTGSSVDLNAGTLNTVFQCDPSQDCTVEQGSTSVQCGTSGSGQIGSYAVELGPCAEDQAAACSFDATKLLLCQQGIWQVKQSCGGANCALRPPGSAGCSAPPGTNGCVACF